MLRKLLLSSALLLSADAVTTAMPAGSLSLTADAHAADFTGRIKRVRIKRKRVGSGFKIVARTAGDSADAAGAVKTEFVALDGGPAISGVGIEAPRSARGAYEMGLKLTGKDAESYTYTLTVEIDKEKHTFTLENMVMDGPWVEDSSEDGSISIRMRMEKTDDGANALAGALDRDHDGSVLDNIGGFLSSGSMTDSNGDTITLGAADLSSVKERYVATLETEKDADPTGYSYTMTTTLLDADGAVTDTVSEQVSFSDAGEDDGIQTVKLRENKKGVARAVTLTNSLNGDVAALEVQVTSEKGEYVLDAYDTEPVSVERWFQAGGLAFDPGESPTGYTYLVLADMVDSNGDPFGEQQEFEVSVDGLDARTAPNGDTLPSNTVGTFSGELLFGTVEQEDDGTYTLFVAYAGDDAALIEGVNLIFEEPYEGPAPLETEVSLPLALEWKKWVQKAPGSLAEGDLNVTVNVVSEEGEVIDTISATTAGTGSAYAADGANGTRKYGDILIDGVPLEFD